MSSIKKLPQSAPSQGFASSDPCSGNNKNGVGVKQMNWPFDPAAPGNSTHPTPNKVQPTVLDNTGRINTGLN